MTVDIRDERFRSVVGDDVGLEQLATGFAFTEGPIWHPQDRHLIFSDIPNSRLHRWSEANGVQVFRQDSNMANGNTYDRDGRVLSCEHATSRVVRAEADGTMTVLASHHDGKELNSPNDIVVRSDGAIYFTDPMYGRTEYYGVPREPELAFRGCYRIDPANKALALLADDFEQPNGLCFSLDETRLYVNDTVRRHIRAFAVLDDGTLDDGPVWAETTGEGEGNPDGMKIDSADNVYCTGPGGIHVFDREGSCLGVVLTPEKVANFAWGDDDLRSLFITACTSLYRIRMLVPGVKVL